MKKILLLFSALLYTISMHSQGFTLSFCGTGASTTVDSVKIDNLTRGISITINGTDILCLGSVSGFNKTFNSTEMLKLFSDPSETYATLQFTVPVSGKVTISIYNVIGKTIAHTQSNLEEGLHTYRIDGLENGIYIIQVYSKSYSYTGKLVSKQRGKCDARIAYMNFNDSGNPVSRSKKATLSSIPFNEGDLLLFTGFSGGYSTIIPDVVTNNKVISFNFLECSDGGYYTYRIVTVGTQTWMAENLRTVAYNDHSAIPLGTDTTFKSPAYTLYENSSCGPLYNWFAVNTDKLCPVNWHVPSDFEWNVLAVYLGSNAGGKLKDLNGWTDPNFGATNETGFGALPGGYYNGNWYRSLGYAGYWWTSTPVNGDSYAFYRMLTAESGNLMYIPYEWRSNYYSVRCIKD